MNFIYDIVLNFNDEFYNFFEWNKKDNIVNIKKMPLFVVNKTLFNNMKYDKITVDKSFIELIKDKTFTYNKSKIGPSCLISNGKEVIGVLFNEKGSLIKRSSLLLDEEEEVLDEVEDENIYNIMVTKVQKRKIDDTSRPEKDKKKFLIKFINSEKNILYLKYLYYDYFEKEESNTKKIKSELIKEITSNWSKKLDKFYDTVKIFNKIKN